MWHARHAPSTLTVRELAARGWHGLVGALERCPEEGLEQHVAGHVRSAMLDYIQSSSAPLRMLRAQSRDIVHAIAALLPDPGDDGLPPSHDDMSLPTAVAISELLGLNVPDYEDALDRIDRAGLSRIDIIDFSSPSAAAAAPRAAARPHASPAAIARAIERLPDTQQLVLMLLHQESCTDEEAAVVLRVSTRDVRVTRAAAIHSIRAILGRF
ncbi:MAG: hypothetical protein U0414_03690 [Polyangiaceae bacterium]